MPPAAHAKDVLHNRRADFSREIQLTWLGVAVTVVATILTGTEIVALFGDGWQPDADAGRPRFAPKP